MKYFHCTLTPRSARQKISLTATQQFNPLISTQRFSQTVAWTRKKKRKRRRKKTRKLASRTSQMMRMKM